MNINRTATYFQLNPGQALWPLPGGTTQYLHTMTTLVEKILDDDPTFDELADWIIHNYKTVNSRNVANGYVRLLSTIGAVTFDGERIKLTPAALEYMQNKDIKKAQRLFLDNVAGAEELYHFIKSCPKSRDEAHQFLQELLGVTWESYNQSQYRLYWLLSLGLAEKEGHLYKGK